MRPTNFPPGLTYLFQLTPRLILPPAVIYLASTLLEKHTNTHISTFLLVLVSVLWLPANIVLRATYNSWKNERDAARLGAVLAPKVPNKWPGGMDKLLNMASSFKDAYPADAIDGLSKRFGYSFRLEILWEERFFTSEPEYIKAILATQFDNFEKGYISSSIMDSLLGTGVFNSDGEMWKFHRAMTRPLFVKERVSHFDIFDKNAEKAMKLLSERLREGFDVDFQDLVSRFTLDSATEFLFAQNVSSLSAGLPYPPSSPLSQTHNDPTHPANVFADAFLRAQDRTSYRVRFGLSWPLAEFWKDLVSEDRKVVDRFIEPMIGVALKRKREGGGNGSGSTMGERVGVNEVEREVGEGESLLDHMINFTEDKTLLKDEIMNIMIAGRDTTASTLTFTVNLLIENPAVLTRLRKEILDKVGRDRRPDYGDVREMKYLRAVLNEVLRLYPAVPFNARFTKKGVVLPPKNPGEKPVYIPAGTRTPYSVITMHRRVDLWGPDALEFDPDRFLDERLQKYLIPNPFIFLPFNAGPRICLGQQFAYNEMSFFLIRLLQNFSTMSLSDSPPAEALPPLEWAGAKGRKGRERIAPKSHLTMYVRGGLWVRMGEAGVED